MYIKKKLCIFIFLFLLFDILNSQYLTNKKIRLIIKNPSETDEIIENINKKIIEKFKKNFNFEIYSDKQINNYMNNSKYNNKTREEILLFLGEDTRSDKYLQIFAVPNQSEIEYKIVGGDFPFIKQKETTLFFKKFKPETLEIEKLSTEIYNEIIYKIEPIDPIKNYKRIWLISVCITELCVFTYLYFIQNFSNQTQDRLPNPPSFPK